MSSDDNHRQAHMTPTARKICGVFAKSSFNFGPATYFVSHYCCGRALHVVFYRRVFFKKKSGAELFDYVVATVTSKVRMVLTPCLRFASSVCFGSFCLASPKTGVASLQEDYRTHQFD